MLFQIVNEYENAFFAKSMVSFEHILNSFYYWAKEEVTWTFGNQNCKTTWVQTILLVRTKVILFPICEPCKKMNAHAMHGQFKKSYS